MNNPTPDAPVYDVIHSGDWCQLTVHDGTRPRVIADGLTEANAQWLVTVLGRRPYLPGQRSARP
ncbi:hypothetical protein [Asanoa siamensis]|uniref:Uncharacterized protein n=1 Tax=Asanoa siamensis TaxID=926357 RepID=A0ABQ4CRB0_9ACTN|nr:hypothetical protein [Asanoa siamensis]GIF73833.1 hypothetical protein Asi02nite_33510 [Asanoa siamensis]